MGQPLDLAVDVRLDTPDDAANACFEADVFHGDAQVPPSRVRVIVVAGAQGQDTVVRIRSSVVVDEPVVGVVLRSVCGQTTSRRFDFLTDFPVETRAAAVPTIIPANVTAPRPVALPASDPTMAAAASAPVAAPRTAASRSARPSAPTLRVPKSIPVAKPLAAKESKEPVVAPKPVATKVDTQTAPPDTKPRLKLESAEAPDERLVQLKPASNLVLDPTTDPLKREAAAAAWRVLNNLPLENPLEKQRLLSLETEAKTLKALLAKNEAELQLRLDKLESKHYGESFVYSLLGLLLVAIAAAVFFWNRARQRVQTASTDWSHHGEPGAEELGHESFLSRPVSSTSPLLPPTTLPGRNRDADVDESLFDDLKKLSTVTMASKPSLPAPLSRVTAVPARSMPQDDFLDIQQHADFYVSLGQYDQAIEVLSKNIREHSGASPLPYLDLLKIYHTLGRQPEYTLQRNAFHRIFNCQIPEFSAFTQEGQTLNDYPAVLGSMENQWGTPEVLDFIESCLFLDTADGISRPFDLAAYREILLLYAIAQGTVLQAPGHGVPPAMPKLGVGRDGSPPDFKLEALKPAPLVASVPRETLFTQPMLMVSEMAPLQPPGLHPEPLAPAYRAPLDLDLDLNLDFSNSELQAMQELSAVPAAVITQPPVSLDLDLNLAGDTDLDLDLDLDLASASPAAAAPRLPVSDSHMLEFDLFDPETEAKISPKKVKL